MKLLEAIIDNKQIKNSILYCGFTNNLRIRLTQHKENIPGENKSFTSKYNVQFLLYYEKFTWIQEAITREKEIKGWCRNKKMELIKTINPDLSYLFE